MCCIILTLKKNQREIECKKNNVLCAWKKVKFFSPKKKRVHADKENFYIYMNVINIQVYISKIL